MLNKIHKSELLVIIVIILLTASCATVKPIYGHKILTVIEKNKRLTDKSDYYISNTDYIITPIGYTTTLGGLIGPFFLPIIPINFDYFPYKGVKDTLEIIIYTQFELKNIPKATEFKGKYWRILAYGKLFDVKYKVKLIDTATGNKLARTYNNKFKSKGTYCDGVHTYSIFDDSTTGKCHTTFTVKNSKAKYYRLEIYQHNQLIYAANIDADKSFAGLDYRIF